MGGPRRAVNRLAAALVVSAVLGLLLGGALLFVRSGVYDVAATSPHLQPVHALLGATMHHAVRRRARGIAVPPVEPNRVATVGAACYRQHCLQCHGGPGVAPGPIGLSMQPLPGPLVTAARDWQAAEVYWITRHGIKLTGMPAWQHRLREPELWAVVYFVQQMADVTPVAFRQVMADTAGLHCPGAGDGELVDPAAPGDRERGRAALSQYGCNGCHQIPGVVGSAVQVGPPLAGFGHRTLLPGGVPNNADNLARWLREPQRFDPRSAMPALGVSARDARDIAAYLGRL